MSKQAKENNQEKPRVHKDLDGFKISVDAFGEIKSNLNIEDLNKFLNRNVDDKKLRDREDLEDLKK